jgi:two-component system KDP operon response regulator KdpE
MLRLAVVSADEDISERLSAEFETKRLAPDPRAWTDEDFRPDAYLVDATDRDRFELVAALAQHTHQPIIAVAADGAAQSARYLELGADACLAGSAPTIEWGARIRAVARRRLASGPVVPGPDYRAGDVAVYRDSRRVEVGGREVRLTRTEFDLLLVLAERIDQLVTHHRLMAAVWGPEHLSAKHYLRVYICRLREKLEDDPEQPTLITTDRGRGYTLRSGGASAVVPQSHAAPPTSGSRHHVRPDSASAGMYRNA